MAIDARNGRRPGTETTRRGNRVSPPRRSGPQSTNAVKRSAECRRSDDTSKQSWLKQVTASDCFLYFVLLAICVNMALILLYVVLAWTGQLQPFLELMLQPVTEDDQWQLPSRFLIIVLNQKFYNLIIISRLLWFTFFFFLDRTMNLRMSSQTYARITTATARKNNEDNPETIFRRYEAKILHSIRKNKLI